MEVCCADAASRAQMEAVFNRIRESMPPLAGVIHAAGVLEDSVVSGQSRERIERAMAPKVAGAWNLHQMTEGMPLDFFVLFSSVASLLGTPGQSGYAAANAFLDGLAHFRRLGGKPGISINWGGWAEAGMAARATAQMRRQSEFQLMPPALALSALGRALRSEHAQLGIAAIDWSLRKSLHGSPPVLENVLGEPEVKAGGLLEQLTQAPEAGRTEILEKFVHDLAIRVLGFAPGRRIDPEQPIHELGLDSLMALEFRNALSAELGRPLPATLLFNYPSLKEVVSFLRSLLFGSSGLEEPTAISRGRTGNALDDIESLSDEEVERMLARGAE